MSTSGEIDLSNLKAKYDIEDIQLVDSRKLEMANEARLYFEVMFGVGLAFMGAVLTEPFSLLLLAPTLAFLALGIFFLIRYVRKTKDIGPIVKVVAGETTVKPQGS